MSASRKRFEEAAFLQNGIVGNLTLLEANGNFIKAAFRPS